MAKVIEGGRRESDRRDEALMVQTKSESITHFQGDRMLSDAGHCFVAQGILPKTAFNTESSSFA